MTFAVSLLQAQSTNADLSDLCSGPSVKMVWTNSGVAFESTDFSLAPMVFWSTMLERPLGWTWQAEGLSLVISSAAGADVSVVLIFTARTISHIVAQNANEIVQLSRDAFSASPAAPG